MTDNNINRLAELLEKAEQMPFCTVKEQANWLLANGVIVPPCKVGNTVWWVDKNRVLDMICVGFVKTHKKLLVTIARNTNDFTTHYYAIWNKEVFLTKEEAEAKLKELKENA